MTIEFKDRIVEYPNRYTMAQNGDGTVTLTPAPGTVVELGTPLNAKNLNEINSSLDKITQNQGDLATLNTTEKNNLVGAVNEVNEKTKDKVGDLRQFYTDPGEGWLRCDGSIVQGDEYLELGKFLGQDSIRMAVGSLVNINTPPAEASNSAQITIVRIKDNLFCVGYNHNNFYYSTDQGATWIKGVAHTGMSYNTAYHSFKHFKDKIFGASSNGTTGNMTVMESYDGINWAKIESNIPNTTDLKVFHIKGVDYIVTTKGIFVGDSMDNMLNLVPGGLKYPNIVYYNEKLYFTRQDGSYETLRYYDLVTKQDVFVIKETSTSYDDPNGFIAVIKGKFYWSDHRSCPLTSDMSVLSSWTRTTATINDDNSSALTNIKPSTYYLPFGAIYNRVRDIIIYNGTTNSFIDKYDDKGLPNDYGYFHEDLGRYYIGTSYFSITLNTIVLPSLSENTYIKY